MHWHGLKYGLHFLTHSKAEQCTVVTKAYFDEESIMKRSHEQPIKNVRKAINPTVLQPKSSHGQNSGIYGL
jgi:hypothetical protein